MGDPWGIGGFRGGGKPNIKQIVKKTVKKSQKLAKSEKNRENRIFFLTENGPIFPNFADLMFFFFDIFLTFKGVSRGT